MPLPKVCTGDTVRIMGLSRTQIGVGTVLGVSECQMSEYLVQINDDVILRAYEKNLEKVN